MFSRNQCPCFHEQVRTGTPLASLVLHNFELIAAYQLTPALYRSNMALMPHPAAMSRSWHRPCSYAHPALALHLTTSVAHRNLFEHIPWFPAYSLVALGLGNGSAQHLCPEECSLCPLDHLLVYTLWWVIHDHSACLIVDLCINLGISDEVDNPLLAFLVRQSKSC